MVLEFGVQFTCSSLAHVALKTYMVININVYFSPKVNCDNCQCIFKPNVSLKKQDRHFH